jgi:phosphoglycolate phosphatase-like HAD superfamily hydrolase
MSTKRVAVFFDFDKTITPSYQQYPLFESRKDAIVSQIHKEQPELYQKAWHPEDYFTYLVAPHKGEKGLDYLLRMKQDAQAGGCLEALSHSDLFAFGKESKPAPGFCEFIEKTKSEYPFVDLYIISVGIEDMIRGFLAHHNLDKYFTGVFASTFRKTNSGVIGDPLSVVTPFTKTARYIETNKGTNLNKRIDIGQYKYDYDQTIVVGDGFTDISKFAYGKKHGASAICVYDPYNVEDFAKTKHDVMPYVTHLVPRDYTVGGAMWNEFVPLIKHHSQSNPAIPATIWHEFKRGRITDKTINNYLARQTRKSTYVPYLREVIVHPTGLREEVSHVYSREAKHF